MLINTVNEKKKIVSIEGKIDVGVVDGV